MSLQGDKIGAEFPHMLTMTEGTRLIVAERQRHIVGEGFHEARDAQYIDQQLTKAAVCYASVPIVRVEDGMTIDFSDVPEGLWPWDAKWWKPGTDIQCLIKAGALIAAEIDRRLANGESVS